MREFVNQSLTKNVAKNKRFFTSSTRIRIFSTFSTVSVQACIISKRHKKQKVVVTTHHHKKVYVKWIFQNGEIKKIFLLRNNLPQVSVSCLKKSFTTLPWQVDLAGFFYHLKLIGDTILKDKVMSAWLLILFLI